MVRIAICLLFLLAVSCRLPAKDDVFPQPPYPAAALHNGIQGTVYARINFRQTGEVKSVEILRSSGSKVLDDATQRWVMDQWKASPSTLARFNQATGKLSTEEPFTYVSGEVAKTTNSLVATNRYLKKAYYAIESQWRNRLSSVGYPRGLVNIQVTFYSDGTAAGAPLDLQSVSTSGPLSTEIALKAIDEASPFPPFPAEMKRELAQSQHGDGETFSERFCFTVPLDFDP